MKALTEMDKISLKARVSVSANVRLWWLGPPAGIFCSVVVFLFPSGIAGLAMVQCEPDGDVQFVCGPVSPEDLSYIPQSHWVVASSMEEEGYLSAVDV